MVADPDNIRGRLSQAHTRRANAVNNRNRCLLNIEIAERNAIDAEGKVAQADAEVNRLLDELLLERAVEAKRRAEQMVRG